MKLVVLNTLNDATDVVSSTEPQMVAPEEYETLSQCVEQCNEEMEGLLTFELIVLMD